MTERLAAVRAALDVAVAEVPVDELPSLIGLLAKADAEARVRMVAPAPPATSPGLVGAAEMAKLLDVTKHWVMSKARANEIPSQKLVHLVRFDPQEVFQAVRTMPKFHNRPLRSVKKRQEKRGGSRSVSTKCPNPKDAA